jgi:hypothetical protein
MGKAQYNELEKELLQKRRTNDENKISLGGKDFYYGKLTILGYDKIKTQCEYISNKEIEIIAPQKYVQGLKESLESIASEELLRMRKEKHLTVLLSVFYLLLGVGFLALRHVLSDVIIINELTLCAAWVLVWAIYETLFFDSMKLRRKRLIILRIVSARITEKPEE